MRLISFLVLITLVNAAFGQIKFGNKYKPSVPVIDYSAPVEYEIGGITVSGSKYLDHNALISITGLKVGDKIQIPGETISAAIKKLWEQGILADVQINATKIEGLKIYLDISLKERARLQKFEFTGINKTEQDNLTEKIKLIRGKVITDALIKNTQLTVKKYFIDKGFLNVAVNIREEEDTVLSNHAILNINIQKHEKVKIHRIYFEGNEVASDLKLKGRLKSTKEKVRFTLPAEIVRRVGNIGNFSFAEMIDNFRFSPNQFMNSMSEYVRLNIFTSSKFIKSEFELDKQKAISYYNSLGYRDAVILSDSVTKYDEKTIDLQIKVEEGRRYYFRNIEWDGNYVYTDLQLSQILGIRKGDIYNRDHLDKKLNYDPNTGVDISSLYMDDGYLFFNIDPVESKVEGDSIDIIMKIHEGVQAHINKVIISGNTQTNDHVVLREIKTLPGQKFNRSLLIRTQREIAQLGYFDPEKINPVPIPNPKDGSVDIQYEVVERPSDQIELSGGWGGQLGFIGTLGVVFNNFSLKKLPFPKTWNGAIPKGDGQRLSVRMQANGLYYQTYSFTFTEPWLGGKKPNSFTFAINHSLQRPSAIGLLKITGVSMSLGRRLKFPDDYFTLSNSLNYQRYSLQNYPGRFGLDDNGSGYDNGTANNINFNTTLSRNSINAPMFPRSGSSVTLSMSLTPPVSFLRWSPDQNYNELSATDKSKWVEYHKWMVDISQFLTVKGNFVINARAHFGFLGRYNNNLNTSRFERFNLGGDGMAVNNFLLGTEIIGLRGYENNSLNPFNPAYLTNFDESNKTTTGVAFNKFVFELRYLISPNPAATIYVHAFAEGGNNFASIRDYNPFKLYRSAGVGARIFMPAFGLIGIDYGYGFDEVPGNPSGNERRFMFTLGQQIR
jgi:outer membrane protein insertion porin family